MADKISKEKRSNIMKSITSQSDLENIVTKALWNRGIRFRKNVRSLLGTPDIVIQKYKVVIFIDSCFWHVCDEHGHYPKSNVEFWKNKLDRNQARDKKVQEHYKNKNWNVKRVWEHEIRENFDETIDDIVEFINKAKENSNISSD